MTTYYRYSASVEAFQLGVDPFPTWFIEAMLTNQVTTTIVGKDRHGRNKIDAVLKYVSNSDYAKDSDYIVKLSKGLVAYPPRTFHLEFGKVESGRLL